MRELCVKLQQSSFESVQQRFNVVVPCILVRNPRRGEEIPPLLVPFQQFLGHRSTSLFCFQPLVTSGTCGLAVLFVCSDQTEFVVTIPFLFG